MPVRHVMVQKLIAQERAQAKEALIATHPSISVQQNILYVLHYHNNLPDCPTTASSYVNKLIIMRGF